jgi:hypothetical protein
MPTTLFIGSAKESEAIADALEAELRDVVTVERWDLDTFRPGRFALPQLSAASQRTDFAVFVLGQEDRTESRGHTQPSPRDNVIFEAGLFTAVLGTERTFYLVDVNGTKLPSDWMGIGYLTYDPTKQRARDVVFEAVRKIKERVGEMGSIRPPRPSRHIIGHWWQFVTNRDDGSVVSLIEITDDESGVAARGTSWSAEGVRCSNWRTRAASFNTESGKLFYYWEGEHPLDPALPTFSGVGEIEFGPVRAQPTRGRGHYCIQASGPDQQVRKCCEYLRACADDVNAIFSGPIEARKALIRARLAERKELSA